MFLLEWYQIYFKGIWNSFYAYIYELTCIIYVHELIESNTQASLVWIQ